MARSATSSKEQWAWSAWTIWRGDLRLLAHVARVAREVVASSESETSLSIKVLARGDCEEFSSPDEFLQCVTPQAIRRFTRLTIRAQGEHAGAEVILARKQIYEFPFEGTWGLVVQAYASGGKPSVKCDEAKAMCDRLRIAVRRGSLPWTRGLRVSETQPRTMIADRLRIQGGQRNVLNRATVTMLASVPFWIAACLEWSGLIDRRDTEGMLTYLVIAQCLIFTFGAPLARAMLPAIEVAELTPGRRMLRLIGRSGILSGTVGLLMAFVQAKAGLTG